jgi:hypothetical protein
VAFGRQQATAFLTGHTAPFLLRETSFVSVRTRAEIRFTRYVTHRRIFLLVRRIGAGDHFSLARERRRGLWGLALRASALSFIGCAPQPPSSSVNIRKAATAGLVFVRVMGETSFLENCAADNSSDHGVFRINHNSR